MDFVLFCIYNGMGKTRNINNEVKKKVAAIEKYLKKKDIVKQLSGSSASSICFILSDAKTNSLAKVAMTEKEEEEIYTKLMNELKDVESSNKEDIKEIRKKTPSRIANLLLNIF